MKSISYIRDFIEWQSDFTFSIPIKVRFSETDLYGHVNNTSIFVYFEEARIDYLKHLGLFNNLEKQQAGFVVADLQCDFLQQMYFDEIIRLFVKVEEIGTTSMDLHYMAKNEDGNVTATGRGRMVMVDFKTNKPKALPKKFRYSMKT